MAVTPIRMMHRTDSRSTTTRRDWRAYDYPRYSRRIRFQRGHLSWASSGRGSICRLAPFRPNLGPIRILTWAGLHDSHCCPSTRSVPWQPIVVQRSTSVCSSDLLVLLPARSRYLPSRLNTSVIRHYKLTTRPQGSNHPLFPLYTHLLERSLPLLLCSSTCFTLFAVLP